MKRDNKFLLHNFDVTIILVDFLVPNLETATLFLLATMRCFIVSVTPFNCELF